MFDIEVNVVFTDKYRKTSIQGNVYRPLVFFNSGMIRSGLLRLAEGEMINITLGDKTFRKGKKRKKVLNVV